MPIINAILLSFQVFDYNTSSFSTVWNNLSHAVILWTYFILSVVFQLKLAATSKRRPPKASPINKRSTVDRLRRLSITNRIYQRVFKRVIELKFFSRAIPSDEKVEKEIEIQREAVQLIDGTGQKFEGNRNSNCCGRVHESKIKFELKNSLVERLLKRLF